MVAHTGFEPVIFALRGRCPGPLDECATQRRPAAARPEASIAQGRGRRQAALALDAVDTCRTLAVAHYVTSPEMRALVFFGLHLVALGVTLVRSRAVPRVLSALLLVAGIGYIIDSFATFFVAGHGGVATAVLVAPAVAGEFGLALWLIIKGVALRAPAGRDGASVR